MRQRCMFGHLVTHGNVKEGKVPILFVPSEANLPKSFLACLKSYFLQGHQLGDDLLKSDDVQ
jgi:hypothetical protein